MKNKLIFMMLSSLVLTGCQVTPDDEDLFEEPERIDFSAYEQRIVDPNYERGIRVYHRERSYDTWDNTNKVLNYNNPSLTSPKWYMTQWGRAEPYSLYNASTPQTSSPYTYATEARMVTVDTVNSSMEFKVNSDMEYEYKYGHKKNDNISTNWSHLLMEQTFTSFKMGEISKMYLTLDYTPLYCNYDGPELTPEEWSGAHGASQFFIYLRLQENTSGSARKIWLGLPLFDSRYNVIEEYHNLDANHVGATNDCIYSASTRNYLPVSYKTGIEFGKTYHIEFDMYDLAQKAFQYACSFPRSEYPAASFEGCVWEDVSCFYINIGYEMPGAFKMGHRFENLRLYTKGAE